MCIHLKGKLLSPAGWSRENKGFVTAWQTPSGQGSIFWSLGHLSWKFLAALSKETNWSRFQQLHWINGIENKEEQPDRSSSWERWREVESLPPLKACGRAHRQRESLPAVIGSDHNTITCWQRQTTEKNSPLITAEFHYSSVIWYHLLVYAHSK